MTEFKKVTLADVEELSVFVSGIIKEHYDPIIGEEQNNYMINMFQSPSAIVSQLEDGWKYYYLVVDGENAGFTAFYPKKGKMYIAKLYIHKDFRRRHIAKDTVEFIADKAKADGLSVIFLNVNKYNSESIKAYEKIGFINVYPEKNPIGNGYFMDDFVMEKNI